MKFGSNPDSRHLLVKNAMIVCAGEVFFLDQLLPRRADTPYESLRMPCRDFEIDRQDLRRTRADAWSSLGNASVSLKALSQNTDRTVIIPASSTGYQVGEPGS